MHELSPGDLAALLGDAVLNLIKRGADGSLVMSTDRWRLASLTETTVTFHAEPPAPPSVEPLTIVLAEVEAITWDRLAKQQARSQVRFRLTSGDLWTFSGRLPDPG